MRFAKVVLVLLATSWAIRVHAQVRVPASVAGFRLVAVPQEAINIPADLRPYIPKGQVLRQAFRTQLASSGETIFLYDDGEEILPRIYLGALRDGRKFKLLDGGITGVEGFLLMRLDQGKNALAVVYHTGEDSADNEFVIFAGARVPIRRFSLSRRWKVRCELFLPTRSGSHCHPLRRNSIQETRHASGVLIDLGLRPMLGMDNNLDSRTEC